MITIPGDSFGSRVAGSLNDVVGLDNELNYESRKSYIDSASRIIRNHLYLSLRSKILDAKGVMLFNSSLFSKQLEYAYQSTMDVKGLTTGIDARMHIFSYHNNL